MNWQIKIEIYVIYSFLQQDEYKIAINQQCLKQHISNYIKEVLSYKLIILFMKGNWMGFLPNGKQINIPNECYKCLDSVILAVNQRSISEMKWLHNNVGQQKELKTLTQKIKEVVLCLDKLFKQQKKQANDIGSLIKQKEDNLLGFLNQCLVSQKDTKYINQRASQICYSQNNKKQLIGLIERMMKNNQTIKQIQQDLLKPGVQSCTAKVKEVLQQNKKAKEVLQQNKKLKNILPQNKELRETLYSHEYLIWQLVNYTQNQSQIQVPNCNSNNKNAVQKQLQIYVKIAEMRMVIRSLDQKLKPYREEKAIKWDERLVKPIDVLINKLQNSRIIFQKEINLILINLHTNKYESFENDIKNCDKQNQQILRKIKSEFETSATNTRKMCGRINDKIKLILYIGKVSAENIPKINSTNAMLREFEKSINNCETLFDIYRNFVNQVDHLSYIHSNSQVKLQQRLKGYIQDLQQIQNKIKRYELQNFFPIKKKVKENQDQRQIKMISNQHQQSAQNKRLIAQVEKYKSMIQSLIKENEETENKSKIYIQQIVKKIQTITKQKQQHFEQYNLQTAKLQRVQESYQTNQKIIVKIKANEQQLLKQRKSLIDQLQRVKRQFEQKQKIYEKTILSSKQTEGRLTNQKDALELKSRSLREQINNFKESLKKQKQSNIKKISEMKETVKNDNKKLNELNQNRNIQQKLRLNIQSLNLDRNIQQKELTQCKMKLNILLQERNQFKIQLSKGVIEFKAHINKQKELLITNIDHLKQKMENIATSLKKQKNKKQNTKTSILILKKTVKQLNQAKQSALQTLQKQKQQKQKLIEQISTLNTKYLSMEKKNHEIDGLNNKIQQQKIENQQFMKKQQLQIQDQKEQIEYLHRQIKTINSHNQTYRQHKQLQIQNVNQQILALKNTIQLINSESKNFTQNQQQEIQKNKQQICVLKGQILLMVTDKQSNIQNNQLKNQKYCQQIKDLKGQIQLMVAEKELYIQNMSLENKNQKQQITDVTKQINTIKEEKQRCIQNNQLQIITFQKQIVNLKKIIQQFEAERQIINQDRQLQATKKKEQLSHLNDRIQQLQTQNQSLKQKSIQINKEQQQLSRQPYKMQSDISFDRESWFCDNQQTLRTAKSLIKQIAHINKKIVVHASLLYRYSPQNKLEWNHFVNKTSILILIKTATNKMIAVYTLAPLIKPGSPQYTGDQKSFIFESNLNGKDQCFYPLLQGKKANACYGNYVSIGKSDLRFGLKDDILEGNFGYSGTSFDTKVKITQLLGSTNKESKVKMLAYEIYEITLDQDTMEVKGGKDVRENQIGQRVRYEHYLNKLKENEEQKISLRQKIDVLTKDVADRSQVIEGLKIKIELITQDSKKNIETIVKQLEKLNSQLREVQNNLTKQKRNNFGLSDERQKCQQKITILQKYLQRQKATSSLSKQEIKQRQTVIKQMSEQIQSLKNKYHEVVSIINNQQESIKQLQDKVHKLQLQIAQQNEKQKGQGWSTSRSNETIKSSPQQLMSFNQNSLRINTRKYSQLAQYYKLDPLLVAHINTLFVYQLLNEQFGMKLRLVNFIQQFRKSPIKNTKLIYKYDTNNLTTFHKYIDDSRNLVLIVKTINGVYLATYYSGKYTKGEILASASLLMTLTYNNAFQLYNPLTNPQVQRTFRGMVYDDFFLIFGNAELRIRANQKIIFSNFGIGNSFFNPRGKKVNDFIGQGQKREIEFVSYEIYEVSFFDQE